MPLPTSFIQGGFVEVDEGAPMTQPVKVVSPGPELDAKVWTLLGYPRPVDGEVPAMAGPWKPLDPDGDEFSCAPISTDWGAAMRALELWALGKRSKRSWMVFGPVAACGLVWERGCIVKPGRKTGPHVIALALLAALGGAE